MNDDATIDIAALTALCQAHPGPYEAIWETDEEGSELIQIKLPTGLMGIGYDSAPAFDDADVEALVTKANAVEGLLAMLAAAQEERDTLRTGLEETLWSVARGMEVADDDSWQRALEDVADRCGIERFTP